MIGAQAGIIGNVKRGIFMGSPAIPHRDFLKSSVIFSQLPELKKKISELEEKVKSLEASENSGNKPA
jgi:UDP-3-O-[3-hydroxymyristoyl] glucosamine N-acyltransferase